MRRFLLLFALVGFVSIGTTQAQKKACKYSKTSVEASAVDAEAFAAKAASLDENIDRKVCEKSGKVSYFQSSTCAKSGATKVSEVQWCTNSNKFVNMSPSSNDKKSCAKSCAKGAKGKAGCSKGAKATSVSAKKGCCAKGTCQKACCAGKKAKADLKEAKAVRTSMEQ